jgi:predicted dehydrogenase
MSPVRIGIVGAGFGARVVAPVFAETDGCEVVDVVSARDDAVVREFCARPDLDLVAVHSPPFLHPTHVGYALDAGHAVLCDKPFGRNADDASAMLDHARAAGALHLGNLEFRYQPGRVALRDLANSGAVGTVEHVEVAQFSAGSRVPLRNYGWLFDAERGGGWIGAWGSHFIDYVRWTFGEIVECGAELRTDVADRPDADGVLHECTAEDAFLAWLRTDRGVSITIDTTFVAPVNLPSRVTVIGSQGALELRSDHRITHTTVDGSDEVFRLDVTAADPHLIPMQRWAEVVRDAVRAGVAPPDAATLEDGLACAQVMDELRASARPRSR